ncbi:MAG: SAF domain-containing protein, partial [Betaproteobacteria bacterium]
PNTIARAVLFKDATLAPAGAPAVEVVATAKRDLQAGEVIDGLGGFMSYGLAENAGTARAENLLPIGLAEGCRLRHHLPQDAVLRFDDVDLPEGRLCDRLWQKQLHHFFPQFSSTHFAKAPHETAGHRI